MRRLLLAGSLLLAPPLAAQAGTVTWSLRGNVPDTVRAMAGMSEFELFGTFATDGSRLAGQFTVGPAMAASVMAFDLTTARLQMVIDAEGSAVSLGVVLPPELAAQMGGAIGFRLDLPIPDSLPLPVNIDSLMTANEDREPEVTNTGRGDVVAGIPCEIWTMTPPADSMPADSMTMTLCLAEPVPAMRAINDAVERHLPRFGVDLEEMKAAGRKYFGGRDLMPIRIEMAFGTGRVVMQLESVSTDAPDGSLFTLPDGLEPFPLEMFQGMLPQPAESDGTSET